MFLSQLSSLKPSDYQGKSACNQTIFDALIRWHVTVYVMVRHLGKKPLTVTTLSMTLMRTF